MKQCLTCGEEAVAQCKNGGAYVCRGHLTAAIIAGWEPQMLANPAPKEQQCEE